MSEKIYYGSIMVDSDKMIKETFSSTTTFDVETFRSEIPLPFDSSIICLLPHNPICSPPVEYFRVYYHTLNLGLRFLICPFLFDLLQFYHVGLCQLATISIWMVISIILCSLVMISLLSSCSISLWHQVLRRSKFYMLFFYSSENVLIWRVPPTSHGGKILLSEGTQYRSHRDSFL